MATDVINESNFFEDPVLNDAAYTSESEQDFARILLATDDVPEDYIAAVVQLREQQNDLEALEADIEEWAARLTYANQVLLAIVKYKGADQFVPVTLALAAVSEYLPEDYA